MGEAVAERSPVSTAVAEDDKVKEEVVVVVEDELQQRPIHVLVVDDCSLDRRIVGKLLQKASFKVTSVESGKMALEVLGLDAVDDHQTTTTTATPANADSVDDSSSTLNNDEDIDLILTDYCMPEMNGYDLLVAVKKHSEKKSTPPVVILSSEYNPKRISSCLENGAEEFLQKPLKPKDMEKFRAYVAAAAATTVARSGTKRKAIMELTSENNSNERLPLMGGVTVA